MTNFKNTTFGVEVEFTGINRQVAIETVRAALGATGGISRCSSYDEHSVRDADGRKWAVVKDASIRTERGAENSCELVTPPLTYDADMTALQNVVRALRRAGARVNNSCGIHVHLDGARHTVRTLRNWINLVASKNDLLYKSLGVDPHRMHYCQKIDRDLVDAVTLAKPSSLDKLADVWYRVYGSSGYSGRYDHYHNSRYHFLNLHSFFQASHHTVEIRGFNSTLHAGLIRSYVVLCLAMDAQALDQRSASSRTVQSDNDKFAMRTWLNRIGFIGDEFKNCREHLTSKLTGCAAWRFGAR